MTRLLFFVFFMAAGFSTFSQGTSCKTAHAACPDKYGVFEYPYWAGASITPETGNNYGCLTTLPNSRWFLWTVSKFGTPLVELNNSRNFNLKYALWGPFTDAASARAACGALAAPVRCSNVGSPRQFINFPASAFGQAYVLVVSKEEYQTTDLTFKDLTELNYFDCNASAPGCGYYAEDPPGCDICAPFFVSSTASVSGCCAQPTPFCGKVENSAWANFIADDSTAIINLRAYYCVNGKGVEAVVADANWNPVSNCFTSRGTNLNGKLIAKNLTPGEIYYIMVDGYNGDVCEFSLHFERGLFAEVPASAATIAGPANVCPGAIATYSLPPTFGANGYLWNVPPSCIKILKGQGSGQIEVKFLMEATGKICVTPKNECYIGEAVCFDFTTKNIPLTVLPDTVVCQMDFPVMVRGQVFDSAGTYRVTLRSSLGCDSTLQVKIIKNVNCLSSNTGGIKPGTNGGTKRGNKPFGKYSLTQNDVLIVPNPTTNFIEIQTPETIQQIEIFDLTGKKLLSQITDNQQVELDISHFNTGTYFLKVRTEAGASVQKLIKY